MSEKEETVWVDDAGDLLKSVKQSDEDAAAETREFVEEMLATPHAYFILHMNLETGRVSFNANVPMDLQLEMLQNAIDNLRRIGQKA